MQARSSDGALDASRALVKDRLANNGLFSMAARPKQMSSLLFARYEPGMEYGSACRRRADGRDAGRIFPSRCFWIEPDSYDGGELVMETSAGESAVKRSCRIHLSLSVNHPAPRCQAQFAVLAAYASAGCKAHLRQCGSARDIV